MAQNDEKRGDEKEREEEALNRPKPEGLIGDTAENRNLSGSTTWETLPETNEPDEEFDEQHGAGGGEHSSDQQGR